MIWIRFYQIFFDGNPVQDNGDINAGRKSTE